MAVLRHVAGALDSGRRAALITIIELDGAFSRPLGAQLAVAEDGAYVGSISGGCLEAALTEQALEALKTGRSGNLRYGKGSPYLDVRLPCGGGVTLHLNAAPDPEVIREAVRLGEARKGYSLIMRTGDDKPTLRVASMETAPEPDEFRRAYAPRLRLVLAGRGWEVVAMCRLAQMWDCEIHVASQEAATLDYCRPFADAVIPLVSPVTPPALGLDAHTALACLFHEHEWEAPILMDALRSPAFHVGALGSRQTQARRVEALRELGAGPDDVARLKSPIGLFPAMDPRSLALSALSEIVAAYQRKTSES